MGDSRASEPLNELIAAGPTKINVKGRWRASSLEGRGISRKEINGELEMRYSGCAWGKFFSSATAFE